MIESVYKSTDNKTKYPCLKMHSDGEFIVLFSAKNAGVVIWTITTNRIVGYFSQYWSEDDFSYTEGDITISNK